MERPITHDILIESAKRLGIKKDTNHYALRHLLYTYFCAASGKTIGNYQTEHISDLFRNYFEETDAEKLANFIAEGLNTYPLDEINKVQEKLSIYSQTILKDAMLSFLDETELFNNFANLINSILDLYKTTETTINFADFNTSTSSLLKNYAKTKANYNFYGYFNYATEQEKALNRLKFFLLGENVKSFDNSNFFQSYENKYDRIFYYPDYNGYNFQRTINYGNFEYNRDKRAALEKEKWDQSNWINIIPIINSLKENGKAFLLMPKNTASSQVDAEIRKYLIQNGYIEAVIEFNQKIKTSNIQSILYVISFNNTMIKLIDGTNFDIQTEIEKIMYEISNSGSFSKTITPTDLDNKSCILPSNYLKKQNYNCRPIALKEYEPRCLRGFPGKTPEKKEITHIPGLRYLKYVSQADMDKSLINTNELAEIEYSDKHDRFIVSYPSKAIIISKMGPNFKIALAEPEEGKDLLINANCLILELKKKPEEETEDNENKYLDPYYLFGFLKSKKGENALRSIASGSTVPIIGQNDLMELEIPITTDKDLRNRIIKKVENMLTHLKATWEMLEESKKENKEISGIFENI